MSVLEENLQVGLAAVKHAKEHVRRSANQHYFKSKHPFKQNKRNAFLLSATRTSNYTKTQQWDEDEEKWYSVSIEKDPDQVARRKELEQVVHSNGTKREKEKKIDKMIKKWGKDYFWNGGGDGAPKWSEEKGAFLRTSSYGSRSRLFDEYSGQKAFHHLQKHTSRTDEEIKDAWDDDDEREVLMNEYLTFISASNAKKFGVGNCQEKAEVACEYIIRNGPRGRKLALFCLEEEHKGLTGIVTGAGGDHVFGVYGFDQVATSVDALGPNAVIVDGWMNDCYPARHHLKSKYGVNYNKERINLKQFTCRNMVCVSYQHHIELLRDLGTPPAGVKS
jgi:hypothetical protein